MNKCTQPIQPTMAIDFIVRTREVKRGRRAVRRNDLAADIVILLFS